MSNEQIVLGCITCVYFESCPDRLTDADECAWFDPVDDDALDRQIERRIDGRRAGFMDAWREYVAQYDDGNMEG